MTRPLRVLYYNWVDYLEPDVGGGVSVYQRNLMRNIAMRDDVDAVFLSSGMSYDLPARAPRWQPVEYGTREDRARRFEILNSGVLSPAHHSFGMATQVADPETHAVFMDFLQAQGPFDVVHFNNLEGVPVSVLDMNVQPRPRVVLSLHNYYPFCPQVNLWYREERTCTDFDAGRACAGCLEHTRDPRILRLGKGVSYRLKRAGLQPGRTGYDLIYRGVMGVGRRAAAGVARLRGRRGGLPGAAPAPVPGFAARRDAMAAAINAHCDLVLCVSDAVRTLAEGFDLRPEILATSYIGTGEAEMFARTAPRPVLGADGTLTLGYLGYMRRDKGFYFLLEALEAVPDEIAQRLRLVVAARRGDALTMERLERLGARLAGLEHVDGYGHDDLDRLLARVGVGVIPVLWHDCLPQVAIEMHARHIPLLCADMGGARELAGCPDMVFAAGDVVGFEARLRAILENRVDMDAYWQGARAPISMAAHIEALTGVYSG